ncbi:VOC family protein [Phytoactinopolyspora endophytica]|uniref:VOC family protein n=1 Tax=Phytoactinopolyspora endophytica TaxID=1642495 RepID=UPI00101D62AC|nr:VOC family protein [Phytoactinopolyspora endophytica]
MSAPIRHQTIFPSLRYRDPRAALRFLVDAFGFTEQQVHENDGQVVHVELSYDGDMVGFGVIGSGDPLFDITPSCVYVVVDDIDAHHARAVAAGAEVVMEPTDQDYGSRDYAVRDPEGNIWAFGTYRPGVE